MRRAALSLYAAGVLLTWAGFFAAIVTSPRASLAALPFDLLERFESERVSNELYVVPVARADGPRPSLPGRHPLLNAEVWPALAKGLEWVAVSALPKEFFVSEQGMAGRLAEAAGRRQVTVLTGGCGCIMPNRFFELGGWRLFGGNECAVLPGLVASAAEVAWVEVDSEVRDKFCSGTAPTLRDMSAIMDNVESARSLWASMNT